MHTTYSFTNRIFYGDCIDIMRTMPSESVDLCVTDPPYLVDYHSRDGRTIASDNRASWLKLAFREVYQYDRSDCR